METKVEMSEIARVLLEAVELAANDARGDGQTVDKEWYGRELDGRLDTIKSHAMRVVRERLG
jgi:hypothetical protein